MTDRAYLRRRTEAHAKGVVRQGRRLALSGATVALNPEEVLAVRRATRGPCAYCRARPVRPVGNRGLVLEHMVPLRRGGDHTIENVTMACRSCNADKGNMTPLEFVCVRAGLFWKVSAKYGGGVRLAADPAELRTEAA